MERNGGSRVLVVQLHFIDGRMRGLFSFLFGASMLLVIERAEAKGAPSATSTTGAWRGCW